MDLLAIALAVRSAVSGLAIASTVCAIGELSLSGDVRRVARLDQRLAEAARLGFHTALVPASALPVRVVGLRIVGVDSLAEALEAVERLEESGRYSTSPARRLASEGRQAAQQVDG